MSAFLKYQTQHPAVLSIAEHQKLYARPRDFSFLPPQSDETVAPDPVAVQAVDLPSKSQEG